MNVSEIHRRKSKKLGSFVNEKVNITNENNFNEKEWNDFLLNIF